MYDYPVCMGTDVVKQLVCLSVCSQMNKIINGDTPVWRERWIWSQLVSQFVSHMGRNEQTVLEQYHI